MFNEDLENVIAQIDPRDFVILLGVFNARVGKDYTVWPSVIGHHELCRMNDNGTQHNLTWQHPRSKMWHMIDHIIDYIIVRRS